MRHLFLLIGVVLSSILWAQPAYLNIQFDYDNRHEAAMRSSIETDSFYYFPIKGGSQYFAIADSSFVLQINKFDQSIYYKNLGLFEGYSVINILNKGGEDLLIQGSKYNDKKEYNNVDNTIYFSVLKKDSLSVEELREYEHPDYVDIFYRPIPTSDGGFFSTGWSFRTDQTGRQSLIFFKCDSNLNQKYFKLYPPNPTENYFAAGAVETPDKHILLVGNRRDQAIYDNAVICKLDAAGNVVFWKEIPHVGDTTNLYFIDIIAKGDGTYLLVGNWIFNPQVGPGYEQFWIVNIDENGNILWQKRHRFEFYAGWQTITPSLDGNFYACGVATTYDNNFPTGFRQYAVISKLTPNGDLLWHRKYLSSPEGKYYDQFFNVLATSDGGILCNGTTWGNDTTRQNAWIVKLDGNGCLSQSQPGCLSDTEEPIVLPVGQNSWVTLSPNPTGGMVHITAKDEHRIEHLRVYDAAGRLVDERQVGHEREVLCDLSVQKAGVYVFSVLVDGMWNVRQVIKQ